MSLGWFAAVHISYISNIDSVNSNYRAYQPMMELERRGHEYSYNRPGEEPIRPAVLLRADVVHIHRYLTPEMLQMIQRLRDAGVGVVWDNDDDVTNVPRSNPHYARFGGSKARIVKQFLAQTVQLADVVTTPSAHLAAQFRAAGASDVRVIENYLPRSFKGTRPVKHDGTVIAWLAGLEHQLDYQRLRLRETLEQLLEARPDLRVLSIGLGLGLRQRDRYEHIRLAEFLDLPKLLARADIGIAPLVKDPWNDARSNIKLKEYGAAGLPWLASPVGAYVGLGEKQGGRLVDDADWGPALEQLIGGERGRRKLAKRASKWADGETIDRHIKQWESAYADASARARSRAGR